jgi:glycerophosphoryl diester phosphodiesterase
MQYILYVLLLFTLACQSPTSNQPRVTNVKNLPDEEMILNPEFDLQGHRGCRGLLPENSIPAFLKAVDLGVNTLELDVVVSKDNQIVVSHEPFFSAEISLTPKGDTMQPEQEKKMNLYQMTVAEIQAFDCGSRGNPRFPQQQKMKVFKPTLRQAIDTVEKYVKNKKLKPVFYNIETKCLPIGDSIYHPKPDEFAQLLYNELKALKLLERVYIQSFDVRTLQAFKKLNEEIPLVLLVENKFPLEDNLKKLGFTPSIYSPNFERLTAEEVKKAHDLGMKVIPWTVNEVKDMRSVQRLGVDGLITDYPNRFKEISGNR